MLAAGGEESRQVSVMESLEVEDNLTIRLIPDPNPGLYGKDPQKSEKMGLLPAEHLHSSGLFPSLPLSLSPSLPIFL